MPLHVREFVPTHPEGPPVVLLHPGPGLDGSVFLPGVNSLVDAGFRALLVDLPGSGRSPGDDFTLRAQAAAVEELMRELEQPTLLGHSFGGYVAMQHLVDFPGSAARLVASSTDADEEEAPGTPENPLEGLPPDTAARVEAAFERERSVSTPEECREVWLDQMPFFAVEVDRAAAMLDDVVFQVEAHHEHDLGELHALDALAQTDIPVLAIVGAQERYGTGAAERIASTAPRGELLVVEGTDHFPFAEAPERYWPPLIDWLRRA